MANKEVKQEVKQEVKGTPNNAGQEIAKQEATTTPNTDGSITVENTKHVSKEVYEDYKKQAKEIVSSVKGASVKIARVFTEMYERGVLEYESDDENDKLRYASMSDFAEKELDLKLTDKQLKNYVRLVNIYGEKHADGTYKIDEKYNAYGIDKLDKIQRHKDFNTRNDFDTIVNKEGINPFTSAKAIGEIVGRSNDDNYDKKLEDKKQEAEKNKQERQTKEEKLTSEVNKLTEDVKQERQKTDDVKTFLARWYGYANDTKMSDKDFRANFVKEFARFEKEFNNEHK